MGRQEQISKYHKQVENKRFMNPTLSSRAHYEKKGIIRKGDLSESPKPSP